MALPSDLIDLLTEFAAEGVEYLLVGGVAVALHGVPRFTKDADVWLRDEAENLLRVRRALVAFGAPAETMSALESAQELDVVWMGQPPARIDLMKQVPAGDFAAAWTRRARFVVGDLEINCVARDDLIALKRASGRPQDLLDAETLERSSA